MWIWPEAEYIGGIDKHGDQHGFGEWVGKVQNKKTTKTGWFNKNRFYKDTMEYKNNVKPVRQPTFRK